MSSRKQFSYKKIKEHWAETGIWHDKFDSKEDFLEANCCFACGQNYSVEIENKLYKNLERAHIKALRIGGDDKIPNIHLLCKTCHSESELLYGKMYWLWFNNKTFYNVLIEQSIKILGAEFFKNMWEYEATKNTINLLRSGYGIKIGSEVEEEIAKKIKKFDLEKTAAKILDASREGVKDL